MKCTSKDRKVLLHPLLDFTCTSEIFASLYHMNAKLIFFLSILIFRRIFNNFCSRTISPRGDKMCMNA